MDGNSQASPKMSKTRFLANINSEDSLKKSTNLLEEILGKKLDRLKAQKAVRESAEQANGSLTRVQESTAKAQKQPPLAKSTSQPEKPDDLSSIQFRTKTSPRQSDPSESQIGSLMSGSLHKKLKSTEKDHVNITTQDGIRSEKNSEVFDIRVFRVPNGVMEPLDSISQQSDQRGTQAKEGGDKSPKLTRFDKGVSGELADRDPLKVDLRRSVTEAIVQEDRSVEEEGQPNDNSVRTPGSQYAAKARRTPTDIHIEGSRKNTLNGRDKNDAWRNKGSPSGYKLSPMRTDNDPRLPKIAIPKNKVLPTSSVRGMLEFSDPLTARASTENIMPIESESPRLGTSKVLHARDKPVIAKVNQIPSSGELKKSCLKKEGKIKVAALQLDHHDDNTSNRNFALVSPVGSKKGILTNKTKLMPNESISVYEMAGMPNRRSNTQMSRRNGPKVHFSEKNDIFEVESYKTYYKEPQSEKECCSRCSLI